MEKYRAIPKGYITVGEVAKKMGVTVRTLQYYDKEGLLTPSAESEGGRRLYTDKDLIQLHQILSLKHLGFSLDDIRNRLVSLDTPAEVAGILAEQAAAVREKLNTLNESLHAIEVLRAEVLQMQEVDFKKYADIIVNLQMKNDFYWLIKHFDDQTLDHIRSRFDKESGMAFWELFNQLSAEILQLQKEGIPPESEQGLHLAEKFWNMILEFTDGDMSLIPKLEEIGHFEGAGQEWEQRLNLVNTYIKPALGAYFAKKGINSFQEETT